MQFKYNHLLVAALCALVFLLHEIPEARAEGAAATIIEEVLVTARKRAGAEAAQDVPVSITAFGEDQLKALGFNNIQDISFSVPNVSLDEVGTARGVASFSIRGLSAASSIITIDPAVATFVDGIYMPSNSGTVLDNYDVESIEVLRGPQGTLFGRNVTGGAVLIRSKRPSQEFEADVLARYEGGGENPIYTVGAAIQGGLTENLSGRFAFYYSDDQGYFENRANEADPSLAVDDELGAYDVWLARGSLLWEPSDTVSLWVKYERLEQEGQSPPSQNQSNFFGRNDDSVSHNFSPDAGLEVDFLVAELNWDAGPGTITNVTGYRTQETWEATDADGTRFSRFHLAGATEIDMFSNELRFSGSTDSGNLDYTVGLFYYESELSVVEQRDVFGGAVFAEGGGIQDTTSWALFTESEYFFNDKLSMLFGLRYSDEEKDVDFTEIFGANCEGPGTFPIQRYPSCAVTSTDNESWQTLGGKLGLRYRYNDDVQFYGHFTRGFRSGGYNVRDTLVDGTNAPAYDEEEMNVWEIGVKADFRDRTVRTNLALFYNDAKDLQRDVQVPVGVSGVQQSTANTADGTIMGVEFEGSWLVTENFLLTAGFGYLDFEYDNVIFDLNGDSVVDSADERQKFPRLADWTVHLSATYDVALDFGDLSARVSYDYRDDVFITDSNLAPIIDMNILSARLALKFGDARQYEVAAFGRNLLDEIRALSSFPVTGAVAGPDPFFGNSSLQPSLNGNGTFSPIAPGRVVGLEFSMEL